MSTLKSIVAVMTGFSACAFGGPDLVCSGINGAISFGTSGDGIHSYSFGTTVCNIGDEAIGWDLGTNGHPVISQTLYKLKDHRITQIGIGFVNHTTIPLQSNGCGLGCSPAPGFEMLGAGCSTDSSSAVMGAQGLMGPRTEINAQSGFYPYPFTSINQTGDANYKRLQVPASEISDPDALYFVETQVVSSSETTPESRENNMSYRQVLFSPGALTASMTGPTYTQQPAIFAWRDHGNGIGVPDAGVMISTSNFPDIDDKFVIGSRVINLGVDHWEYHYAILNLNGDLGVRQLGVYNLFRTIPDTNVLSTQFDAPSYHDDLDDQIVNTAWDVVADDIIDGVEWSTETFEQNPDANAIRWGTMYSFSFEAENQGGATREGPDGAVNIQLFGPGQTINNSYWLPAWAPPHCDCWCTPDLNGDGELDFIDISQFVIAFSAQSPIADFNGDTEFDFLDISLFVSGFAAGCP